MEIKKFENWDLNEKREEIDALTIVHNILKQYDLKSVEKKGLLKDLANTILQDLGHAGYLK